jgi:hypothetical protein
VAQRAEGQNPGELNRMFREIGHLRGQQNAPGKISSTADGWTADTTKASFLGMTAH